jgi:predicted DsbA family dithiol-disulfide isomerase
MMTVEIWSDVVCPWCYIGKRRFEAALAQFAHRDEVELTWRSFELNPASPRSDDMQGTYAERLAAKYHMSVAQAQERLDHMTSVAAGEGLDFHFELARGGNTFDAHRLLHLALERGLQDALKERLDRATFGEGLSVSDHGELTRLAVEVGLDEAEVTEALPSNAFADAVRADEAQALEYGVSGVPFFVIDGKFGVSGAQSPEHLLKALEHAWQERSPITVLATAGEAGPGCEGDDCTI